MNLLDKIGNTPLVEIEGIKVKLEHLNPSGSVKDRIAKYIVEKAERENILKKGYTIVEATSGNTGIAFSMVAALKGYKMIVIIPKGLSEERTKIAQAFGAKVIKVTKDCVKCAVDKRNKIKGRVYFPKQFENPWNVEEHQKHFGQEIIKQTNKIDAFVAGVGTGGTIIGVGKALKKKYPKVKIIAVEPKECPLLSQNKIASHKIEGLHKEHSHKCTHHKIEGIGDGFIPKIIQRDKQIIDEVLTIKSQDAIDASKKLSKKGYFVGPSSGANFLAAKKLKRKYKNIVTLFPDSGERYISENIFS